MKILYAGAISTALIIVIGIALVIPIYFRFQSESPIVMLVFSVIDGATAQDWFDNLSTILRVNGVPATLFITGDFVNSHPGCLDGLAESIDVGSQTYSYVNLTNVSDYLVQLQEVKRGKEAVDAAGNFESRLFMAPFRATDDNLYSILNRSGILADFSSTDHYTKVYNGRFLRFDVKSYNGSLLSANQILQGKAGDPIIIYFESFTSIARISELLASLKSAKWRFINASEITGLPLTERRVLTN
ncbi:polysaccharide deacetylase family protein [Candidatus Bathyarchaeota archaeon]|nr:polysaccharide deacetylase family protein [Candidatus Bathyarchaeota archaeon]